MRDARPTLAGPESNGRPTIYVIDPDHAKRGDLTGRLAQLECSVREFASAEAFLAEFKREQTGCLVLELQLPGLSGIDLLKRLKEDGTRLRMIVLAGEGNVSTAVSAMRAGAVAVIEEPYVHGVLLKEIRRFLT